ncbi:tetratricopeptide repeat protein [Thalassospiraceae bacterium LMO-JJ14]|nr:tetratricopeptide repeat protein [Thalassospiraceae bacterium LMO-JJ14]
MAVHVKPVKVSKAAQDGAENAVHFYRRDIDARPRSAGSFLGAFVKHSGVSGFFCQSHDPEDFDDFVSRVAKADTQQRECRYVAPGDRKGFRDAPLLRLSGPDIGPLMWRRRTFGQRHYSIVGEIENLGAAATQAALCDLLIAPAQHWDAVVYPSKTVKQTAERLLQMQAEYLGFRMGGEHSFGGVGFVIPPGINAGMYEETAETQGLREGVRRRLGIREEDFCVLTTGNFAFYQRSHPTPLYLALEATARRTGVRIHLLQAGWFDNEKIERAYREAIREFAPAVNAIFLDGREADIRDRVWFAADAYAAFDDALNHGVDTEMLEAMAAGLPVVAADWGANRDIVANGENGYLVPTWLPLPESGGDLTLAPENEIMGADGLRADTFLAGTVSQTTVIDIRAAAETFEALAGDMGHRRKMSAAARQAALQTYDWPVVIRRHQALWSELRRVRADAAEIAPPIPGRPAIPHLDDPFSVFKAYATHAISEHARVSLSPGIERGEGVANRLKRIRSNPINDTAGHALLEPDEQDHCLSHLSEREAVEVIQLAELLPEKRRYRLPRTLGWLAKMGVVRLTPSAQPDKPGQEDAQVGVSMVDLGLTARRQGSDKAAAEYFQNALAQNPTDPLANQFMGELLAEAHHLDQAVNYFEKAVAGNPTAVDARLDLGKALFLRGDQQGGIAYLQDAVSLAPENADAHYLLGAAYRHVGAADEAVKSLERSLRLSPKRIEALVHLGYARKSAGRRAEALQAFKDALRLAPGNLLAHAGEMSLAVERDGRKLVERDSRARRVALHFNGAEQFYPLSALFRQAQSSHWPLLTSDGRDLVEFKPDVIVVGGTQTAQVRELVPNALIISAPVFLASQNRFRAAFDGADIVCAPGQIVGDAWVKLGLAEALQVRVCGHLPLDPLFRGDTLPTPRPLMDASATVLYAPGHRPQLSSAGMLGENIVDLIRGARHDVTLVIKPHPETFIRQPKWIETWARAAHEHERVFFVDDPETDLLPYLKAADVLVSDVSSVVFDYLAVDRPIILLKNPEYSADEAAYDPQGIEWRWREIGRDVARTEDLARAVDLALKTPDAGMELRTRYRDALFGETMDGATAERMVELISELST